MTAQALEAVLSVKRLSTYRNYVLQELGSDDLDKALQLYALECSSLISISVAITPI